MRPYYVVSGAIVSKENDSVIIKKEDQEINVPLESIDSIIIFGNSTLTTPLLGLLAKRGIPVFIYSFNGKYITSIMPDNFIESGFVIIRQAENYIDMTKRMKIAKKFVEWAAINMNKVLIKFDALPLEIPIDKINSAKTPTELMGIEGNFADEYFGALDSILPEKFMINERTRQPPLNFGNALISFGNSLVYSVVISEIFHTYLNPSISFLHEPGYRRSSLGLDISEIFKPLLSHTVVISLIKRKLISEGDFTDSEGVYLNERGKRKFLGAFDEKIMSTYYVNSLKRKASFKHIIRLEIYKVEKYILGEGEYKPFSPRRW